MIEVKVIPVDTVVLLVMKKIADSCYEGYKEGIAWYLENYKDLEEVVVAIVDNEIIGYCGIIGIHTEVYKCYKKGFLQGDRSLSCKAYLPLTKAKEYYLFMIALLPEYRQQGIGTRLKTLALTNIIKYCSDYKVIAVCNEYSKATLTDFSVSCTVGNNIIMYKEGV